LPPALLLLAALCPEPAAQLAPGQLEPGPVALLQLAPGQLAPGAAAGGRAAFAPGRRAGRVPAPVRRRELRADIRAQVAALGTVGSRLRLQAQHSGAVSRLSGTIALQGGDLPARAADFTARFGALFDADARTAFAAPEIVARDEAGRPTWVRLRQEVAGVAVADHGLMLRLDGESRALEAHGILAPVPAGMQAPAVAARAARAVALAHLQLDAAELVAEPVVALRAEAPDGGSVRLVQRVELVRRQGLQPLAIDVDAQSGAVLAVRELRSSGGNLVWDGAALPFATGKGKGNIYTSIANAVAGKESGAPLTELTIVDVVAETAAIAGTLTGRYATVSDFEAVLYNPARAFVFGDSSGILLGGQIAEYEAFDHVNTYAWITRMAGWLGKVQGGLASDTCLPVIVNYDDGGDGYANAFYSSADIDGGGGGFGTGYFVFGDFDAVTGDPGDDFSRDPSVVCHEYAHGLVDKSGFTFGDGALDTPSRAVNEAIADYAAASFLKDPRVGHAFMAHSAEDLGIEGDALRDLTSAVTLQDNLHDTLGFSTSLPEEHDAGEIFGAALWRARTALKAKLADDLILDGLAGWPQSNAEAGYPVVNPGNADEAYLAYYHQCFRSMMDGLLQGGGTAAQQKAAGKLLGAFLAHGITGAGGGGGGGEDETLYTFADADTAGLSFSFTSEFLGSLDEHRFAVALAAGQTLSISVKGAKSTQTQVDFACDDAPGDFVFGAVKKVAPDGTAASQAKIKVGTARTCEFTVLNTDAGGGAYTLTLKVK
jgi:hypothetical protein